MTVIKLTVTHIIIILKYTMKDMYVRTYSTTDLITTLNDVRVKLDRK